MRKSVTIHANLLRVRRVGVLLIGEPGIGKTRCTVELVRRGYAMVADDAVRITRIAGDLVGRAPTSTKGLLHVRGSGLVDASEVFGKGSFAEKAVIRVCVELMPSHTGDVSCRTDQSIRILGTELPKISIVPAESGEFAAAVEKVVDELLEYTK